MPVTIRTARPADLDAIKSLDAASFGDSWAPEAFADVFGVLDIESFLVATDGDIIIGTTADYPFTMTVPGGALEVPGVTWVAVEVTHRRRGVLRGLMQRQLSDFRAAGKAAAILTASESGIYGRYGYGVASHVRKIEIDRRRVSLHIPGDASRVERVSKDVARKRMPEIHERWRAINSGALSRSDAWWDLLTKDRESERSGMSELFYLMHDDGFLAYRIKGDWNDGDARHMCWIADYIVVTPEAHRDLWQVVLGLDLTGTISGYRVPIDDPLQHLVNESRLVKTTHVGDGLWLRPLDVPTLLAARTYAVDVDVVIGVRDELFGDGTYLLRGGNDGATCAPTDRRADVTFDVAALGAAYLGGTRLAPLSAAGRIDGDPSAMTRLDRAFLTDRAPNYSLAF